MGENDRDGGPAFPHDDRALQFERAGMTLRDYFAAKAMQGMLGGHWPDANEIRETARRAYLLADEMLKAKNP